MCETLDIPKSTYYQSLHKTESNRDRENREFTEKIIQIHEDSKKRYGAPKIHEILVKQGHKISLNRVQRLMKKAGIQSIIVKKFRPTSSKEKVEERENIIKRDFSTTAINQKWVGDITYIHTLRDGWCYLASVLDLHSSKSTALLGEVGVVGFCLAKCVSLTFRLSQITTHTEALSQAIKYLLKVTSKHQIKLTYLCPKY